MENWYIRHLKKEHCTVIAFFNQNYLIQRETVTSLRRVPGSRVIAIDIHPHPSGDQVLCAAEILKRHGCGMLVTINEWGVDTGGILHAFLEQNGIIHLNWSVDDPFFEEIVLTKKFRPSSSRFDFVSDQGYISAMADRGYKVRFLPLATDPAYFHPALHADREWSYDIIFVGNSYLKQMDDFLGIAPGFVDTLAPFLGKVVEEYHRNVEYDVEGHIEKKLRSTRLPDGLAFEKAFFIAKHAAGYLGRKQIVCALAKRYPTFTVFGEEGWKRELPAERIGTAKYYDSLCATYQKAKITIDINRMVIRNGFTQRTFDVPACGSFLITSSKPVVHELFETKGPDQEMTVFSSLHELMELIDYYLDRDQERRTIARRGMEKILARHTYDHRIAEMLSVVSDETGIARSSPFAPAKRI
ncbi:MAG: glycosyltransferase [Chitinispirillaceae bacterium]|nr:glycosyltransferase [Chitinispirillaceae bacterium]